MCAKGTLWNKQLSDTPQETVLTDVLDLSGCCEFQVGPSDSGDTPDTAEDSNFRAIYSTIKYLADRLTATQVIHGGGRNRHERNSITNGTVDVIS